MFKLPYRGLVPPREAKYSSWTNVGDPCDQSEALDGLPLACVCRKSVGQKQRWQSSTGKKHIFQSQFCYQKIEHMNNYFFSKNRCLSALFPS